MSALKSVPPNTDLPSRQQPPPQRLSVYAREVWRSITLQYPPTHFTGANLPLLEAFCRSADEVRQCDVLVSKEGLFSDTGAPHPAVAVRRATVAQMASLAVKLRLSISTTMRAEAKDARPDPTHALRKPWQA